MPGCSASPAISPGYRAAQLFGGGATLDVGERNEAEVARGEHDHVGLGRSCVPSTRRIRRRMPAEHDVAVHHLVAGRHGEHLADPAVLVAHGFGERRR